MKGQSNCRSDRDRETDGLIETERLTVVHRACARCDGGRDGLDPLSVIRGLVCPLLSLSLSLRSLSLSLTHSRARVAQSVIPYSIIYVLYGVMWSYRDIDIIGSQRLLATNHTVPHPVRRYYIMYYYYIMYFGKYMARTPSPALPPILPLPSFPPFLFLASRSWWYIA